MRLLVLGGTVFVGHAVAADAVRRGHEVVCAARGRSGAVPDGAKLVTVDRDAPDGLAALAGSEFDAVVDVATASYPWVERALLGLAGRTRHWTLVSTVNVYADKETIGQRADAPLLEPLRGHATQEEALGEPDRYGAIKVAAEQAVRETMGEHAFIVRPGLITGPGDPFDRFGYWPARMSEGGRVLVPDAPDQPAQLIDVRDLAGWIVDAAERDLGGTFDAIAPHQPLPDLLREIAGILGTGAELVPASVEQLSAAKVVPWAGPRSLPLWLGGGYYGFASRDARPALDAGLRIRPLPEIVTAALEYERVLGVDRSRMAGLTRAEEAEVLATL